MPTEKMLEIDEKEMQANLAEGKRLNIYTALSGKLKYNYLPEPKVEPRILIVESYRLSTYLGQYGAGRTIKTYSLLPGEKTTISISTYKRTESTSKEASSILDSYTEESADEFETSVMSEQSSKENTTKSFEYYADAEASATWGWGSAKVSGGVSGSSTSAREEFAKNVSNSTSKHAAKASAQRNVEVNTSFETTEQTGEETAISREIQNINVGRTLNFTFRQMNQEFITILHLIDVRVAFFNSYGESRDEVPLAKLDDLLDKYVAAAKKKEVKDAILAELLYIRDYQDREHAFVEEVKLRGAGSYWRVKKEYVSLYKDAATGTEIVVPGIILKVTKNVMRTDGVIVEALLGQADALDDYSKGLQDEKVEGQRLANEKLALEVEREKTRNDILRRKDIDAAKVYELLFPPPPPPPEDKEEKES